MPTYAYFCPPCDYCYDVVKPMAESHSVEHCPKCQAEAVKGVSPFAVDKLCLTTGSGVSTETWNPGLGCYTKSIRHGEQIAKERGLEPVGSEPVEKIHKHYDKAREEKNKRAWAETDKKIGDVLRVHSPTLAG